MCGHVDYAARFQPVGPLLVETALPPDSDGVQEPQSALDQAA
jgi:hypothetical protein